MEINVVYLCRNNMLQVHKNSFYFTLFILYACMHMLMEDLYQGTQVVVTGTLVAVGSILLPYGSSFEFRLLAWDQVPIPAKPFHQPPSPPKKFTLIFVSSLYSISQNVYQSCKTRNIVLFS